MKTVENSNRSGSSPGGRLFVPMVAGVVAAAIGLLALLGWVSNHPLLASFGTDLIPMAPSTAALFVLYGAAVCLRVRQPAGRRAFQAGLAMVGLGTAVALLLFVLGSLNIHWKVEHLGLNITQTAGKMVIGHISQVSALCFVFVSLSFLASLSPVAIPFWRSVLALGAAGLLLGTCFVFLLAYIFGAPLLYGGAFIPPALNSILAFALLGLALVVMASRASVQSGGSPEGGHGTAFLFVLVFALLAAGIVTLGYRYYRNYEQNFYAETERELSAIADLKASDLVQWRKERLDDGAFLFGNENISDLVRRFFGNPADADAQRQLQVWSEKFRNQGDYDVVRLLDAQGVTRLSLPAGIPPVSSDVLRRIPEILRAGQVTFQDFHRNENDHRIYLDILVPIFDPQDGSRPLGIFYLRINPEAYLYPFLKRWPVPSATAETLLVRREGDEAVFLNEMRFQTNTALNLRIPLANTNVVAVKPVLGQTGIVEGRDALGALVIADVCAVPDSPWFLVAREDGDEVLAPARQRLWQVVVMVGLLIFSWGAGVGLVWRQQRIRFYREKSEAQADRARLGAIVESSHDAIIGKNLDGLITSWNLGAERIYGYGVTEAVGKPITMLIPPEKRDEFTRLMEKIKRGEPVVNHDAERIRKDGERIQVSLTLSPVKDAAGRIVGASAIGCDITEQKRMEAALNHERGLWQTLLDTSPDKIYFKDTQSRFIKCSQSQARDFGKKSPDEMVGRTDFDIFDESHARPAFEDEQEIIRTGRPIIAKEEREDYKDGHVTWVTSTKMPMRDADGRVVGIMGISRDITERKQAEEALHRSREEFKDLFDNAPVGFHELDAEGRLIRINNTELKILGHTAEELLGQFVWKLSTDEETSRRATLAKLGGDQTLAQSYERIFRRKDGSTVPVLVNDRLLKLPDGVIIGIHSTVEDITARKAAEKSLARRTAELARERLFLRTLIDNLPDIIFAKDAQYRFTLVNTACARQLGAGSVEAVPGKTDTDFVSPELASQYLADEQALMQSGEPVTKEEPFQHKGTGELRWSLTTKVPLKDDAGKVVGLIGIARDITERREAEVQLQRTMAELERSNKELEQFAYIASHDLQEPLRMVSSYTQLLAKRYEGQLDEKTKKYVHYAVDGASRMQSLIIDLLAYSRVGRRGKPLEPADSRAILGEALQNLAARIEETGAVITNGDLPTVRADASQLVLVFQNLISNAIKFRREGVPGIHVSARDKGGEWLFAVKDNGIGIEARHADRVFVIFQRLHTREEYPGTGIGLSVCKRVVERHGGKIWFESEPGNGTTFFFTIPK